MSRSTVSAEACVALGAGQQTFEPYPSREVALGALPVVRALPVRDRRLVGPWCFLDRYGPLTFSEGQPMDVAPHPHIGLQTVTWLLDGEVAHDDSLGWQSVLRPGGVNVMTAGAGIAHAETTPRAHSGHLSGLQLWVALPDAQRGMPAAFQHLDEVPLIESRGGLVRVFAGAIDGTASAAGHFSPLLGADVQIHRGLALTVPLDPSFEHAVLVLEGRCRFEGQPLDERVLYYLGTQRTDATFDSDAGARLVLLGGPPFPETILMWWNFVARTPDEIAEARADWEAHRRFGVVRAYRGPRLDAPSLVRIARPNPVS
jgi:redox-sensitive bicupin YhaK (pirin superfamily)